MTLKQFQVVGRAAPTANKPDPQIYRMRLFASNPVQAKSRFWYFTHKLAKMKKTTGQILQVNEIVEKNTNTVKVSPKSTIKPTNQTIQLVLEKAQMAISGIYQMDEDVIVNPDTINLFRGTMIPKSPSQAACSQFRQQVVLT